MKISILTLFPKMFQGPFDYSIIKRAKEKNLVQINFVDIREFGLGKHKTVDDKPYGGGVGMILKVDVLKKAIDATLDKKLKPNEQKVILLGAAGKTYDQKKAEEFSRLSHLILICGHYEGVDERIKEFIDEEISVGSYILTGGEVPAMIIADSVTRLIPGVLREGAVESESFSDSNKLEYPQYTRPDDFEGLGVPEVLLSGNHGEIRNWKNKNLKKVKKAKS